jgi:tRNA A37 threonylcarbamoyltransferase TsaD
MKYYVGLDVSLKQTSICVVNQTGSVVREGVVHQRRLTPSCGGHAPTASASSFCLLAQ